MYDAVFKLKTQEIISDNNNIKYEKTRRNNEIRKNELAPRKPGMSTKTIRVRGGREKIKIIRYLLLQYYYYRREGRVNTYRHDVPT